MASASSPTVTCSPVETTTSCSRWLGFFARSVVSLRSRLVSPAMAETTTTTPTPPTTQVQTRPPDDSRATCLTGAGAGAGAGGGGVGLGAQACGGGAGLGGGASATCIPPCPLVSTLYGRSGSPERPGPLPSS